MCKTELTIEQVNLLFGEKLDSTIFTWQKHCSIRGVSVITIFDNDHEMLNKRFVLQGWCDASSLQGGYSKQNGFAIMLWDKKERKKLWCHVSVDLSTTWLRRYELINGK
jgi:hypothetical protein